MTTIDQNPEPFDPEAWYAARKAEFAQALPNVGITTHVAVQGLSALYDADLRRLVPEPGSDWSNVMAGWLRRKRLALVKRDVAELLGEDA